MSLKHRFVLIVGTTALLLASTAAALCSGNLGPRSTPDSAFTLNADDTVVDSNTGLMWKRCIEGVSGLTCSSASGQNFTWSGALAAATASRFAGYSDWRLPNYKELFSLIDNTCDSPAVNSTVFPGGLTDSSLTHLTWTSTTYGAAPINAWYVDFVYGEAVPAGKAGKGVVRLVRSGAVFDRLGAGVTPVCDLDVNGDGVVTADKDAVLLLRDLLGFRGAALIAGVPLGSARADAQAVQDFIGTGAQFDLFGRPSAAAATALRDGLVLTRLMLGVADVGLLGGIAVPTDATFTTGSAVRGNLNARCGTNF